MFEKTKKFVKENEEIVAFVATVSGLFIAGYCTGYKSGKKTGREQLSKEILNDKIHLVVKEKI